MRLFSSKSIYQNSSVRAANRAGRLTKYQRQLLAVVLALAALLCILAAVGAHQVSKRETVFPGVTVEGVRLSGMTRSQATAKARVSGWDGPDHTILRVLLPADAAIEVTSGTAGWSASAAEAGEAAWNFGRDRGMLGNFLSYLSSALLGHDVAKTLANPVDREALRAQVSEAVGEVNEKLSEGAISEDYENGVLRVIKGAELLQVDENLVFSQTVRALSSHEREINCVRMPSGDAAAERMDMSKLHDELCCEARDSYYDVETQTIAPARYGVAFDAAQAQELWDAADVGAPVDIPIDVTVPQYTSTDPAELYHYMLSYRETSLAGSSYNRVNNVKLAASKIDGKILMPGETFSYNETLGQRTWETGFREAGAYSNGVVVQEVGGGICQVSSTLYYCAMLANLNIVERTNHYFAVGYIEPGMDATVSWGAPDFKFENNRTFPIVLRASVENGMLIVNIWGTDVDGSYVSMTYEQNGLTAVTYRNVYDRDGNLLSSEQEAVSIYHPHGETAQNNTQ